MNDGIVYPKIKHNLPRTAKGSPEIPPLTAAPVELKGAWVPLNGTKNPELSWVTKPKPVMTVGFPTLLIETITCAR